MLRREGLAAALVALVSCATDPATDGAPKVGLSVPVTANPGAPSLAYNSPTIAVDPTDERFAVLVNRVDAPEFDCSFQVSGDGGRSWLPARPIAKVPAGVDRCYGPEVAFDGAGKLYYLFVGLQGVGNVPKAAFLTTSADRARSFSTPRQLLGPHAFQVRMAIDRDRGPNGRIHLVWIQANSDPPLGGFPPPPNPILASHSDDGGKTFSAPVQVSKDNRARVVAPTLAIGPEGEVHVLYYDLQDDAVDYQGLEGTTWEGNWSLVLRSSRNGGESFGREMVVDREIVPPGRVMLIFTMPPPALAVGPDGRLFAAWHDARNTDWDVFLRSSTNSGKTWTAAKRLNDDPVGNGRHQYLPRLSVSPNGRLDAIFYDRREDPDNIRNHVFYAHAAAGKDLSRNLKLTRGSFDSRIGEQYPIPSAIGQVEFGSRLGLFSLDDAALAAWTDTQNARSSKHQDIYSSRIEFRKGRSGSRSGPLLLAVLAVGAVGTGIAATGRRRKAAREKVAASDRSDAS